MSVFDAIKNNRGNSESGIYMSYVTYEQRLREAQAEERERIVALLDAKSSEFAETYDWADAELLTYAIALIKGENK